MEIEKCEGCLVNTRKAMFIFYRYKNQTLSIGSGLDLMISGRAGAR